MGIDQNKHPCAVDGLYNGVRPYFTWFNIPVSDSAIDTPLFQIVADSVCGILVHTGITDKYVPQKSPPFCLFQETVIVLSYFILKIYKKNGNA